MSADPFAPLSDSVTDVTPDLGAIKGRAKRIERRQRVMVGASAASVAAVALIAVLLNVGSPSSRQVDRDLASRPLETTTQESAPEAAADNAAGGTDPTSKEGGRSSGTAGANADTTMEAPAAAGPAGAEIYAAPEVLVAEVATEGRPLGGATFTLEVCNTGKEAVERDFTSGQRYDFVVSKGKDEIWTWSKGQNFTQATGTEKWEPGECKQWEAVWDGRNDAEAKVANGEYTVVGTLTERNAPVSSKPKSFCSGIC